MLKQKMLLISVFCLSISMIISAIIIANAVKGTGEYIGSSLGQINGGLTNIGSSLYYNANGSTVTSRNTFDLVAASTYLGISESRLIELVNAKGSKIPYVKIADGYIFSKNALEKWLETTRLEIK